MSDTLIKPITGTLEGPEEIRIPVPWGHIAAKAWGDPDKGFPVLAVHGWMDNAGTFDRLIPLLPRSLYIVAVDLVGHGFSSHLPKGMPYHYADTLTVLRRITTYFKWSKFSWIGHSMGAGLGAFYASCFSSQVISKRASQMGQFESKSHQPLIPQIEKLVMIDLIKPITGPTDNIAEKTGLAVEAFLAMEEKLTAESPSYSYEEALKRLILATDGALDELSAKTLMIRGSRRVSEDRWSYTRDIRLRTPSVYRYTHDQFYDILSKLKCPLLLLKAKSAPYYEGMDVCNKTLDVYRKNSSDFRFVEVEGNHFIHLNEPEKINNMIGDFLVDKRKASL